MSEFTASLRALVMALPGALFVAHVRLKWYISARTATCSSSSDSNGGAIGVARFHRQTTLSLSVRVHLL